MSRAAITGAVALHPGLETRWTIISGSMKGNMRVMDQANFTVGRNPECEFVISNDPKCSRRQAGIRVSPRGCEVTTLNDKNPVLVNGREVETALLNEGDIVTFGDTEVQFSMAADVQMQMDAPVYPQQNQMMPQQNGQATQLAYTGMQAAPEYTFVQPTSRTRGPRAGKPAGNNRRFIIYAVIAGILYWLFMVESPKKKETSLRTQQETSAEIEATNKIKEARENENSKRMDPSINARQAQENYVRGFRDYRKGQFERSTSSFQACLALDPGHLLCNRYLRLSQRKFNEMIQYYVLLGRKYRDQNQFQSCRSAFRNVMVMVKDANNETYKLAKANYEACNAFIEGRF